ncbi:MAG: ybgC [Paucimonas sp.]|nr:ybgC [Paucimonas sp.]
MAGFSWDVRVYFEDTDAGGIVFYANYLKFFERARTEWLRAAGVNQQTLMQEEGRMFVVRSTAVDYFRPARLDDRLQISVVVEKLGRASVEFFQQARRQGEPDVLCSGRIKVACVDSAALRPGAIPASVLAKIDAFHPPT